ncbi:hypothetical protein RHSIM_Rhsim01G0041800 [Rhododendron simsii]|uniref:GH18 domain-containing protein n=1 Tax=Rhododendron simsii TaxID=118357 RepID=A0A834LXE8_RHOSS|nr:hypothetical protein RHSIM_Rhsim01G0041800 [Rhododendron simsii]
MAMPLLSAKRCRFPGDGNMELEAAVVVTPEGTKLERGREGISHPEILRLKYFLETGALSGLNAVIELVERYEKSSACPQYLARYLNSKVQLYYSIFKKTLTSLGISFCCEMGDQDYGGTNHEPSVDQKPSSVIERTSFCELRLLVPDSGLAASDIDSTLFTHIFCAFADLDSNTNQVTISSSNNAQFSQFTKTVQLKNPSVKTLLSIGGGSADKTAFASMASQLASRKSFIDSSINLAR